jgi:hypothetical protein
MKGIFELTLPNKYQRACSHRAYPLDGIQSWAIGLQHNFPDGFPRGICLICAFVIHPMDPLYPVVEVLDRAELANLFLQDVYAAATEEIVTSYNPPTWHLLRDISAMFTKAKTEIFEQSEIDTKRYLRR